MLQQPITITLTKETPTSDKINIWSKRYFEIFIQKGNVHVILVNVGGIDERTLFQNFHHKCDLIEYISVEFKSEDAIVTYIPSL